MNFIPFVSPTEQAKGLMYRKEPLGPNAAGLFIYDKPEMRSFWMKNTNIPLSIAYIGDTGEIINIEDMSPHKVEGVKSHAPARYALEMRQGWFSKNGITGGDTILGLPIRDGKNE